MAPGVVLICRGQGIGLVATLLGYHVHDVSAEAPCAGFHKPPPRKRPHMPRSGANPKVTANVAV
jgi:hypothetical protein